MQLKTILNRVQKFKSFVCGKIVWLDPDTNLALLVEVVARANSKPICSSCGSPGPGYDTLEPRMFEFVPLWNIAVFFAYALRRVNCTRCGVKVEAVPWADGKHTLCGRECLSAGRADLQFSMNRSISSGGYPRIIRSTERIGLPWSWR